MSVLLKYSTAPECRARTLSLLDDLANEWSRQCLGVFLRHWWGEVQYDVDTCPSTLEPDIVYRWDGTERLGQPRTARSREFARTRSAERRAGTECVSTFSSRW